MATGLKAWDASGNLVLDVTDRITRIVSRTSVAVGASGTIQLPEGTPWWYFSPGSGGGLSAYSPSVTYNSTTRQLSYAPNPQTYLAEVAGTLTAGVY